MRNKLLLLIGLAVLNAGLAPAAVTLLLEEPFGTFGGMNPTGHAAVYFSHVCAASLTSLRRCHEGEDGVVISRYHNIAGYDWLAVPLMPYLYAVDRADEAPSTVTPANVGTLRNAWRRAHLSEVAPDDAHGDPPQGDWTQLVGAAYDRTLYAFEIAATQAQEDRFIRLFNSRTNKRQFNILFHNCADFARNVIDFFYPHAVHRSLIEDMGIMTPKEAARSLVSYSKRHHGIHLSVFVIPQVDGTVPRSRPVRGVLESLVKSRKYAVPLVLIAALHPYAEGSLALAWIEGTRFDPRRLAAPADTSSQPSVVASELESNGVDVPSRHGSLAGSSSFN